MVQLMSLGIDRFGMIQDGAPLRALELGWFVSSIRPKMKLMIGLLKTSLYWAWLIRTPRFGLGRLGQKQVTFISFLYLMTHSEGGFF